jgi:hypothetical protein
VHPGFPCYPDNIGEVTDAGFWHRQSCAVAGAALYRRP